MTRTPDEPNADIEARAAVNRSISSLRLRGLGAPLKRSAAISLVLLGVASCEAPNPPEEPTIARDTYATREDCLKDWSDGECESVPGTAYASGSTYFYGPFRFGGYGYRPSVHASGFVLAPPSSSFAASAARASGGSISRGGFGSSAAAHGSASS